ncbi:hypothetical protein F0562_012273 [Nyssa sinensis]|uniref:Anaphase-promoting complex subunit 4 WD40 domain-containing protein n=1 Tax=Nyssa sinensis TaxID=561372 RepID=A0A5J4ZT44_9ASTE|nr:hypothetical protein F0562_012273 [Nyssa sinensis]
MDADGANLPVDKFPETYPTQGDGPEGSIPNDLPKTVARILNQQSSPTSMNFHPVQQTLLLVGTIEGGTVLWEVGSMLKLVSINFEVWHIDLCSIPFQVKLLRDPVVVVHRVLWSPDGSLFGVAFSEHIVQIYSYHGGSDVRQHLEIDSHVGGVNDIAFVDRNSQLFVVTCGDDKTIKVWDVATGELQCTFDEHEASVYCLCPHYKDNIHSIFSTAMDGKIRLWLYDNMGSRIVFNAPGKLCTTMAYSSDGTRLFSCGTSTETFLVEWDEREGSIKRTYQGFSKPSVGVVQFDTIRNQFLAAGDNHSIRIWDMENVNLLATITAGGGLPASPGIHFNKDGTLLAVTANDNKIKILGTVDGLRLLESNKDFSFDASDESEAMKKLEISQCSADATARSAGVADKPVMDCHGMDGDTKNSRYVIPRLTEEVNYKSTSWKLTEIDDPAHCRSLRLHADVKPNEISRLIYTSAGNCILALASNGIHLLWRWPRNELNSGDKATTNVLPQLWQPSMGLLMTNDMDETNTEKVVPCFALSKTDSYLISASGGQISLYNMFTFKVLTKFMSPPPAATSLALHPQDNNVIAIGRNDSSILIYDIRFDAVKSTLMGHYERITGLAFSGALNVLVSVGADNQIIVWNSEVWEKRIGTFLQIPWRRPKVPLDSSIKFHQDQIHFLIVHGTQLGIYETTKLECVKQWFPGQSFAPIMHAEFSCDGQLIYASFLDGIVGIFGVSSLYLQCLVYPTAYLPIPACFEVEPLVIAAHPQEPNQFAVGLSNGEVMVLEPLESESNWGLAAPAEIESPSSMPTAAPAATSSSSSH